MPWAARVLGEFGDDSEPLCRRPSLARTRRHVTHTERPANTESSSPDTPHKRSPTHLHVGLQGLNASPGARKFYDPTPAAGDTHPQPSATRPSRTRLFGILRLLPTHKRPTRNTAVGHRRNKSPS